MPILIIDWRYRLKTVRQANVIVIPIVVQPVLSKENSAIGKQDVAVIV